MRCLGCGYDLRSLPEHRCPECGRPFDSSNPATYAKKLTRTWPYLAAGALGAIQQLEPRSDEELKRETKHRAAARAILGARAAERYDSKQARAYFNEALAGAHPQERPMLRQMMKAALAQAERQLARQLVHIILETEPPNQLGNPSPGLVVGNMEQLIYFPMPSQEELRAEYYRWWRSANM